MFVEVLIKNLNVFVGFKKFYKMVFFLFLLIMNNLLIKNIRFIFFYYCLFIGDIFGNLIGFWINNVYFFIYIF